MSMPMTLQKFMADHGVAYKVVPHRFTDNTMNTVNTTHLPAWRVAKPVILEDEEGYVMAVVPANLHVKIGKLNALLHRKLGLATEAEIIDLFSDCAEGAVPPVGEAYNMETVVDDRLKLCPEIYIEAGDHKELLRLKARAYRELMKHSKFANIGH